MSDKQFGFLRTLLERIDGWDAEQARRKAEDEAAEPAPTGRVVVSGEVLATKSVESDYGTQSKVLVKADAGWKLWCTNPNYGALQRGDKVTLKVTVTPSNDDPKFAYGKRPTVVEDK